MIPKDVYLTAIGGEKAHFAGHWFVRLRELGVKEYLMPEDQHKMTTFYGDGFEVLLMPMRRDDY